MNQTNQRSIILNHLLPTIHNFEPFTASRNNYWQKPHVQLNQTSPISGYHVPRHGGTKERYEPAPALFQHYLTNECFFSEEHPTNSKGAIGAVLISPHFGVPCAKARWNQREVRASTCTFPALFNKWVFFQWRTSHKLKGSDRGSTDLPPFRGTMCQGTVEPKRGASQHLHFSSII